MGRPGNATNPRNVPLFVHGPSEDASDGSGMGGTWNTKREP